MTKITLLKKAELASGIGALILGIGLGVLFSGYLKSHSLTILIIGVVMHAWG